MGDTIEDLFRVIESRRDQPTPESYTARLFDQGQTEIAKKVGEEAVEVVAAALSQSDERLTSEAADLVYHLLVLLAARRLDWSAVTDELERRRR